MLKKAVIILMILSAGSFIDPQREKIVLSSLEWEPYSGKDLPGNGFVSRIAVEAFSRAGYAVEIQFYPWARSLFLAETGAVDGLIPEYYDERRLPNFIFSEPFKGGPVGFLIRKDSHIKYQSFKDLSPYTIGVVRGYINNAEFDSAEYLKKFKANSDETNIKMLYAKRVDLIFIDRLVADSIIKNKFPGYAKELVFLTPPVEEKMLYIAFSKKAPDYARKCAAFNEGLKKISADGTLARILSASGL